jgi:hypothetical protein
METGRYQSLMIINVKGQKESIPPPPSSMLLVSVAGIYLVVALLLSAHLCIWKPIQALREAQKARDDDIEKGHLRDQRPRRVRRISSQLPVPCSDQAPPWVFGLHSDEEGDTVTAEPPSSGFITFSYGTFSR